MNTRAPTESRPAAQTDLVNARLLARHIDHTMLRPDARRADIERVCREAVEFGCATVCVNPIWVALAGELLAGSPVKVVAVIGFPFGATHTATKVLETELAIRDGADEIDMVLAIGQLKDGDASFVVADIAAVVDASAGRAVKVVLECGLLSDDEKRRAVELSATAGAAFVKTATGFLGSGATIHDVRLLRRAARSRLAVKATGGIRFFEDAVALLDAGASRLGTSHTQAVLASQDR
jgi:deoxyribose-phosphate aldolase